MRILLLVFLSAIAVVAEDSPAAVSGSHVPDNLTIPARLDKTVDTKKCKAGDAVEMRTLEPVLIANGLVMPENTRLHGKVVASASRQNDQPSWVVLVLERAEWKQHSIPLHAFVASRITLKAASGRTSSAFEDTMPGAVRRRRPALIPTAPGRGTPSTISRPLQDALVESEGAHASDQGPDHLRIAQDKNGNVFLVSQEQHLKLPSGTMFMLRHRAATAATQASATATTGSTL